MKNHDNQTENQFAELIKQKEKSDKLLLAVEWIVGIFSLVILMVPIFVISFLPMEYWAKVIIVFSGFIIAMLGFGFAVKIEQVAGYYECTYCKHVYVPKFLSTCFAMHIGRIRYMNCPQCHKRSWQRKKLRKPE